MTVKIGDIIYDKITAHIAFVEAICEDVILIDSESSDCMWINLDESIVVISII